MNIDRHVALKVCLALGAAWGTGLFAADQAATITTFDAPGAALTSGLGTLIYGINAAGTVTGHYADSANIYHGFILTSGGTFTAINAPGTITAPGKNTFPESINDVGAVTGYYQDTNSTTHGFVYTAKGTIISF